MRTRLHPTDTSPRAPIASGAFGARIQKFPARPGVLALELLIGDPGFTATYRRGKLTFTGVAQGPIIYRPPPLAIVGSRGVRLTLDRDHWPDFNRDPNPSRHNLWYFSHTGSATTSAGMTAAQLVEQIAADLNHGRALHATPEFHADGTASLTFARSGLTAAALR